MKTHDEMKAEVLAYCEEVCPNEFNKAHLEIGMAERRSMASIFYWLHVHGLSTVAVHGNATDDHIFVAYRLLGLETRDAIAEVEKNWSDKTARVLQSKDLEIRMTNEMLQAERVKSAVLVEALENLCHAMKYRTPLNPNTIHELAEAEKALETYKKGGSND